MSEQGEPEVRDILQTYVSDPRNLYLLAFHLFQVREGARGYLDLYAKIFALPSQDASRRDALMDVLIEVMVLMEDLTTHASELHKEIKIALEEIDKEDEGTASLGQ